MRNKEVSDMPTYRDLGEDARPQSEEDWGTERQIDAINLFHQRLQHRWPSEFDEESGYATGREYADYCLKATDDEMIEEAYRILGPRTDWEVEVPGSQQFPSTAQVMDLLFSGQLVATDSSVGRLQCMASVYHEGLWYKVSVQTTDLLDVKALFGDNDQPDNVRDPAFPDRLAK
jgi:hypothetical protein